MARAPPKKVAKKVVKKVVKKPVKKPVKKVAKKVVKKVAKKVAKKAPAAKRGAGSNEVTKLAGFSGDVLQSFGITPGAAGALAVWILIVLRFTIFYGFFGGDAQ